MKVYLAAPLFNEMELKRNKEKCELLEEAKFDVYLPQRDGGILHDISKEKKEKEAKKKEIYEKDIRALENSDILVLLMDGLALDEGGCFELGYMKALGKKCFGYKTDIRSFCGEENLMISESLDKIFNDFEKLIISLKLIDN